MNVLTGASRVEARQAARPARRKAPWRDPAGRFSVLKLAVLVLVLLPALSVALAYWEHGLGGRPITEALHRVGDWAVRLLLVALAISPARYVLDWPRAMILRRMLGVAAASYAGAHFVLYCFDQKWQVWTIGSEIVLRFYLTIGFVALLGLIALAATSFDRVIRRMGRSWKKLHRLVYPVAALALFHYFIQSKANVSDAVLVAGLFAWLMLWRTLSARVRGKLWVLPLLAIGAGLATAAIEGLWYRLATNVDAGRVLMANLDLTFGPRPAVAVAILGLVVFVVAAVRRLFGRPRARAVVSA